MPTQSAPFGSGKTDYSVRDESRAWMGACAKRVPDDKTQTIDSRVHELCRKPNYYYSSPVRFVIAKKDGVVRMEYKIRFTIYDYDIVGDSRSLELLEMARACSPEIRKVWERYGVDANVEMDSDRHPSAVGDSLPRQSVLLVNYSGRSNSGTFYSADQDSFCRMMVHEVGHHFGLEDEYYDTACPDRPFVSKEQDPYSVMNTIWGMDWDNMDFYGRHVRSIFADYCGDETGKAPMPVEPVPADYVDLGFPE